MVTAIEDGDYKDEKIEFWKNVYGCVRWNADCDAGGGVYWLLRPLLADGQWSWSGTATSMFL